ncbi:MAG: YeeE/YedE family protein [Burkholderiales bacterium]
MDLSQTVVASGFALGFIFGAVTSRTNFCVMGAISDVVNIGSWNRMRMWLLAIAVAIIGANALEVSGMIDLSRSIYQTANFAWLSYALGGAMMGVGMTLASGCPSKTLMRLGSGNLKSLIVFVFIAIAGYMTLKGLFGVWRIDFLQPLAAQLLVAQDLPSIAAKASATSQTGWQIVLSALIGGGLLAFIFSRGEFRTFDNVLGGLAVGLLVVAGWYVTGSIGYGEDPQTLEMTHFATNSRLAESLSMVAPAAYGLELLLLWSDASLHLTFGIAAAAGVALGAFFYAVVSRSFRWEGFRTTGDMGNHIAGGVLMGTGGVLSLGCTIGQGITGLSTLAMGSIVTFVFIIAGAAATMRYQYWQILHEDEGPSADKEFNSKRVA